MSSQTQKRKKKKIEMSPMPNEGSSHSQICCIWSNRLSEVLEMLLFFYTLKFELNMFVNMTTWSLNLKPRQLTWNNIVCSLHRLRKFSVLSSLVSSPFLIFVRLSLWTTLPACWFACIFWFLPTAKRSQEVPWRD